MSRCDPILYLEAKQESKIVLGLGRIQNFLTRLGDPHKELKVIHVAGTNAKGSVCKMLQCALTANGYKTGLYLSPHLFNITERISIDGRDIDPAAFADLGAELMNKPGHERLSYFEFLTAMALLYFKRRKTDLVVLETGLGGRLDATNIIENPLLSVITTIAVDHKQWLGSSLGKIAREKAGILKSGRPAVIGRVNQICRKIFEKEARRLGGIPLTFVATDPGIGQDSDWNGAANLDSNGYGKIKPAMRGPHQIQNARLALTALNILTQEGLRLNHAQIKQGLEQAQLAGRWDLRFIKGKPWVFDVGHNPHAMNCFLKTFKICPWYHKRPKTAIIGFMNDKDHALILVNSAPHFQTLILPPLPSPRACPPEALAQLLPRPKIRLPSTLEEGVQWALADRESKFIAVFGSFRVVGPVLLEIDKIL